MHAQLIRTHRQVKVQYSTYATIRMPTMQLHALVAFLHLLASWNLVYANRSNGWC